MIKKFLVDPQSVKKKIVSVYAFAFLLVDWRFKKYGLIRFFSCASAVRGLDGGFTSSWFYC